MAIRLIISINASAGNGNALGEELRTRSLDVKREPGCEQYEVFQSLDDPDSLVLLERWQDQAALDAHAAALRTRAPMDRSMIAGASQREDYEYNRTR